MDRLSETPFKLSSHLNCFYAGKEEGYVNWESRAAIDYHIVQLLFHCHYSRLIIVRLL